jgi:NAD(P)-dependent dehydrogenase (short-subunit alcohol dehydrogenase family)
MTQCVLITGGSRGIGAACAVAAATAGYDVCLNYASNADAARAVAAQVQALGRRCELAQGNVAEEAEVLAIFDLIDRRFGRLDALINNAGILETHMRLDQMTVQRLNRVFGVNITGSFLCAREAVKRMSTKHGGQGGAIVNLSSLAARLGSPNEYIDYAASKGAIDSMTIGLAKEVAAEGIRVNAVRPGLIYTEIHASGGEAGRVNRLKDNIPMKRGGTAAEVAQTVLWLLSAHASYVTGTLIDVGGGR